MGQLKAVQPVEIRVYDDNNSPETSDYTVLLPITTTDNVVDFDTGESVKEIIEGIIAKAGGTFQFTHTFNATTDWTSNPPYTITITAATHHCGVYVGIDVFLFKDNKYVKLHGFPTKGFSVDVDSMGKVTLISKARFAGRVIISGNLAPDAPEPDPQGILEQQIMNITGMPQWDMPPNASLEDLKLRLDTFKGVNFLEDDSIVDCNDITLPVGWHLTSNSSHMGAVTLNTPESSGIGYLQVLKRENFTSTANITESVIIKQIWMRSWGKTWERNYSQDTSGWSRWIPTGITNAVYPAQTINNVALANLQGVIDSLPKVLMYDVTINTLPGTHNGTITITNFSGPGTLIINGDMSNTVGGTTSHTVTAFNISFCLNNGVYIVGFNSTSETVAYNISYCFEARLSYCRSTNFGAGGVITGAYGLNYVGTGTCWLTGCNFSNKQYAYRVYGRGRVTFSNCEGMGNQYGYMAYLGAEARIQEWATTANRLAPDNVPSCATALFYVTTGGDIVLPGGGRHTGTVATETYTVDITKLAATIATLPKFLKNNVVINVNAGTTTDSISITDFTGNGSLTINGNTINTPGGTTTHTVVGFSVLRNNNSLVSIVGFNATSTSMPFDIQLTQNASVSYCRSTNFGAGGVVTNAYGISYVGTGLCMVVECNFSNKQYAYRSFGRGKMTVHLCDGTGNTFGFMALAAAELWVQAWSTSANRIAPDNVPSCATMPFYVESGGDIVFPNSGRHTGSTSTETYTVDITQLNAVIATLPRHLKNNVTINVNAGTTNDEITIARFFGAGELLVQATTPSASSPDTRSVNRFIVSHNTNATINIRGFSCTTTNNWCVAWLYNSCVGNLEWIKGIAGVNTTGANQGIHAEASATLRVTGCTFSNKYCAAIFVNGASANIEAGGLVGTGNNAGIITQNAIVTRSDELTSLAAGSRFVNWGGGLIVAPNIMEEGTWLPALRGSTTAGTVNYGWRGGIYKKIGRLVYIFGYVNVSSWSGVAGNIQITGVPFSNFTEDVLALGIMGLINLTTPVLCKFDNSATPNTIVFINGLTDNQITNANIRTTGSLYFGGCYSANSANA